MVEFDLDNIVFFDSQEEEKQAFENNKFIETPNPDEGKEEETTDEEQKPDEQNQNVDSQNKKDESNQEVNIDLADLSGNLGENKKDDTSNKNNDVPQKDEEMVKYFNMLKNTDILSVNDDFVFDGTEESLEAAIDQTRSNIYGMLAKDMWNALPDEFKPLLDYALSGGKELSEYLSKMEVTSKTFDLEREEDQKTILTKYYKQTTSLDDEKIKSLIDKSARLGDLETEAVSAYKEIKDLEIKNAKDLAKQQEENAVRMRQEAEETATKYQTIIKTAYKDKTRAENLTNFLLKPDSTNPENLPKFNQVINTIVNNPDHMVQLADLLMDYTQENGFNLERFKVKAESEAKKSFKEKLHQMDNSDTKSKLKGGETPQNNKGDFDWSQFNKYSN